MLIVETQSDHILANAKKVFIKMVKIVKTSMNAV